MGLQRSTGGVLVGLVVPIVACACTTGDQSAHPTVETAASERRGQASTTLRVGDAVTYAPGEVEPLVTRIRCLPGAAGARPITALVPRRGKSASVIADGESGYRAALAVTTADDGKVAAACD